MTSIHAYGGHYSDCQGAVGNFSVTHVKVIFFGADF